MRRAAGRAATRARSRSSRCRRRSAPTRCVAALAAGQRDFGENRAQELAAQGRRTAPGLPAGEPATVWHFIGRLQRNKVKSSRRAVTLWHSVDRVEIGEAIAASRAGRTGAVQVNVGDEEQKGGCRPDDTPALVDALSATRPSASRGSMTVPPQVGDPRPHFATLRELAADLGLATLSMGMSGDFEAAIAEGATIVRVGTAVFGARPAGPGPGRLTARSATIGSRSSTDAG